MEHPAKHEVARALLVKGGTTVEELERPQISTIPGNHLQRPFFHGKGLVAADAPALTNVLKSEAMARVKDLVLANNKLGDGGAAAIAAAAAGGGMLRLETLCLSDNQIGVAGMQALVEGLAGGAFRELEDLGLNCNNIGDAGWAALATALEKGALPALKVLWLDRNKIGDDGAAGARGCGCGRQGMLRLEAAFGQNDFAKASRRWRRRSLAAACGHWRSAADYELTDNPRLRAACEKHSPSQVFYELDARTAGCSRFKCPRGGTVRLPSYLGAPDRARHTCDA